MCFDHDICITEQGCESHARRPGTKFYAKKFTRLFSFAMLSVEYLNGQVSNNNKPWCFEKLLIKAMHVNRWKHYLANFDKTGTYFVTKV